MAADLDLTDRLDPRRFYEYAARQRAQQATGLERFVYQIIPYRYIGSFAFAIDPLSSFKVSSSRITPTNRKLERTMISIFNNIYDLYRSVNVVSGSIPNYNGQLGYHSPFVVSDPPSISQGNDFLDYQSPVATERLDTTTHTRPIGSTQGEFKKFEFSLRSPPRSWTGSEKVRINIELAPGNVAKTYQDTTYSHTYHPVSAWLGKSIIGSLRDSGYSTLSAELSRNIQGMYREVMPASRKYTLFRNVVELKDLPRSIATLQQTARSLYQVGSTIRNAKLSRLLHDSSTVAAQVPDEYLSYMFGWRQLYKDVLGLLNFSETAAKRINFLNSRSGKETNLRLRRKYPLDTITDSPGWEYPVNSSREIERRFSTTHKREIELRMVVNTIVDFPPVDTPRFRQKEFLRQLGVVPTIGDLYELTPWSWLADWYFGLANYIQLMEQVNKDNSLINWGVVTAILRGSLSTTYSFSTEMVDHFVDNDHSSESKRRSSFTHTSVCDYDVRMRINAANALSKVGVASEGRYVTDFQSSILGALLAQRSGFHKS